MHYESKPVKYYWGDTFEKNLMNLRTMIKQEKLEGKILYSLCSELTTVPWFLGNINKKGKGYLTVREVCAQLSESKHILSLKKGFDFEKQQKG